MAIKQAPMPLKLIIKPIFKEEVAGIKLPLEASETPWGDVVAVGSQVEDVQKGDRIMYEGHPEATQGSGDDLIYILHIDQIQMKLT